MHNITKLDSLVLYVISTFFEASLSFLIFQRVLPNQIDTFLKEMAKASLKCLKIGEREKLMKTKKCFKGTTQTTFYIKNCKCDIYLFTKDTCLGELPTLVSCYVFDGRSRSEELCSILQSESFRDFSRYQGIVFL